MYRRGYKKGIRRKHLNDIRRPTERLSYKFKNIFRVDTADDRRKYIKTCIALLYFQIRRLGSHTILAPAHAYPPAELV